MWGICYTGQETWKPDVEVNQREVNYDCTVSQVWNLKINQNLISSLLINYLL